MTIATDQPDAKGENLTSALDSVRDPRTCGVCAHWHVVPSEDWLVGECASDDANRLTGGVGLVTNNTFGCRFWELTWERPLADEWKRRVILHATRVVYAAMVQRSRQSSLPNDVEALEDATRLRVEAVALHLLNALGFFRP